MENWDSSVNPQRSSAKVSCQSLLVLIAEMVKDETQEEVWGKQEKDWVWQQPIGLVWNLNFNKELDGLVYVTKNIIEALNIITSTKVKPLPTTSSLLLIYSIKHNQSILVTGNHNRMFFLLFKEEYALYQQITIGYIMNSHIPVQLNSIKRIYGQQSNSSVSYLSCPL